MRYSQLNASKSKFKSQVILSFLTIFDFNRPQENALVSRLLK
jgi:hypothetical protein